MLEWMMLPFKRYADFRGRSRRKEFWAFMLLNALVYTLLLAIMFGTGFSAASLAGVDPGNPFSIYASLFNGTGLLLVVWGLAVLVPNIAVTVRRLHDRDLSGWWYLGLFVAGLIPVINFLSGIAFFVVMCLKGTNGPNRFGPDPKNPTNAAVFA